MALAASGGARGGTGAAAPRRIALANYGGGEPNVAHKREELAENLGALLERFGNLIAPPV